jgi:hypothetical protein
MESYGSSYIYHEENGNVLENKLQEMFQSGNQQVYLTQDFLRNPSQSRIAIPMFTGMGRTSFGRPQQMPRPMYSDQVDELDGDEMESESESETESDSDSESEADSDSDSDMEDVGRVLDPTGLIHVARQFGNMQ